MRLASIERIRGIHPHTNADSLEIAEVLGYECIVPKDHFRVGQLIVLIQPDTVLPDDEWADVYKKRSKRVKAMKIRGQWSFGIIEELDILPLYSTEEVVEGLEVGEMLGITKYEAPEITEKSGNGDMKPRRYLPFGIPKTDETRYQNINVDELIGEPVIITQKIDGQSFSVYYHNGEMGVCGRTMEYSLDGDNNYTRNFKRLNFDLFALYCKHFNKNLVLRGEQYGVGIQRKKHNPHCELPLGVKFFSVFDIDLQRYISPFEEHNFVKICKSMEGFHNSYVPVLYEGPLTRELIDYYEKAEDLNGKPFEGVVVKGHKFSFKVINFNYDNQ